MKWEEVRTLFPNTWVLVKVLNFFIEDDVKYIDQVEVIRDVNEKDVVKEFKKINRDYSGDAGIILYHTSQEEISFRIRHWLGVRM